MMRYCILNYCTNEILHPGKYQLLRGFVVYVVYTRSGAFDSMASRGTSMYIHVLLYGLKGDIHLRTCTHTCTGHDDKLETSDGAEPPPKKRVSCFAAVH